MNKVSIVIPCYNCNKDIRMTVKSALYQTYKNIEIIIIDDGSDNQESLSILEEMNDKRIAMYRTVNNGVSVARNIGVKKSTGEYILFLDADDIISPDYVEECVKVLDEDKKIALVYSYAKLFGSSNKIWGLKKFTYRDLLKKNQIFISSLIRKKDFLETDGFSKQMSTGLEDWEFWIRFLKDKEKVCRINKILFFYRIQEKSRTKRVTESLEGLIGMKLQIINNNIEQYIKFKPNINKLLKIKSDYLAKKIIDKVGYELGCIVVQSLNQINMHCNFKKVKYSVIKLKPRIFF